MLYADLRTEPATLLDPRTFCARILEDGARAPAVLEALERGARPEKRPDVAQWKRQYARVYGRG